MKLTVEDIGKHVKFGEGFEDGILIGFENNRHGEQVVLRLTSTKELSSSHTNIPGWYIVKSDSKYNTLFKKFGCNEKYVKELIIQVFKDLGKELPK